MSKMTLCIICVRFFDILGFTFFITTLCLFKDLGFVQVFPGYIVFISFPKLAMSSSVLK